MAYFCHFMFLSLQFEELVQIDNDGDIPFLGMDQNQ
jgi:hypothetical protein